MTWREQIKGVPASFRGVPFKTTDTDGRFGRRKVVHEYPQRDLPYVEDLGMATKELVINGYVLGDDYLQQREALIKALSEEGPGQLVHPRWGRRLVDVVGFVTVKEGPGEGGKSYFSFTVVDAGAGNPFPLATQDTAAAVDTAAERCDAAAETRFIGAFKPTGAAPIELDAINQAKATLDGMLDTVRQVTSLGGLSALVGTVKGLTGNVATLIRTPLDFSQGVRGMFSELVATVRRPIGAIGELQALFKGRSRPTSTAMAGSTLDRIQRNQVAYGDFVRTLALTNQARLVVAAVSNGIEPRTLNAGGVATAGAAALPDETPVATANQVLALRDQVLAQIDDELEINEPDPQTAAALEQLRAAVAGDVAKRGQLLRERSTFTPVAVLPALALAHRIYQDANRADELVTRNAIRHPGFVPAQALEVLK